MNKLRKIIAREWLKLLICLGLGALVFGFFGLLAYQNNGLDIEEFWVYVACGAPYGITKLIDSIIWAQRVVKEKE
jgi:hypothetical protein